MIIDTNENVEVVSFPRDTLVGIPTKGYWTLNALYLVYGIDGLTNWFKETYDITIDNYIVYELDKGKILHKLLGIDTKYEYDQAWLRHRHKLNDYHRQIRIQQFATTKVMPNISKFPNINFCIREFF